MENFRTSFQSKYINVKKKKKNGKEVVTQVFCQCEQLHPRERLQSFSGA